MRKLGIVLATCMLAGFMAAAAQAATLDVNATAALEGNFGLEVIFNLDSQLAYVQDDTPADETVYRALFQMDPSNLSMPATNRFTVLFGRGGTPLDGVLRLELRYVNSTDRYRMLAQVKKNSGGFVTANDPVNWLTIGNGPVTMMVEVEFGNVGAGSLTLTRLDTMASTTNDSINNGNFDVELVRFGVPRATNMSGTDGSLYLDDFQSFRTLAP